jgi:hypothetical protein
MKNSFLADRKRILRIVTIVNLIIALLIVCANLLNIVSNAISISQNPLIPKYILYYASFVPFIVIVFFTVIALYCFNFLRRKIYKLQKVSFLFGLTILFFIFTSNIFHLLMYINPFQN